MSEERAWLPEGTVDMPPGPELAAALAGIDPQTLNGHDLVHLAPVYVKLISHLQAGLATVLNQVQHSPAGDADSPPERTEHPNLWSEVELAAKLHWSAGRAGYELRYAHHLTRRLPIVHAALAAGVIDWHRARVIVDGVAGLDDHAAQLLAARVLAAGATEWSPRQVRDRLRRMVIDYEPAAARRRQRQRLAERRVQVEADPEGTADLYALNLSPERVMAIVERITAIAHTAKRLGDGRSVDQLKADALVDLLAGTGIAATPPGPLTDPNPSADGPQSPKADLSEASEADFSEVGVSETDIPDGDVSETVPDGDFPAADVPDGDVSDGDVPEADVPDADAGREAAEPGDPVGSGDHRLTPPQPPGSQPTPAPPAPLPGPRRGVVELRVNLSTLIGWDDEPADLAGYGPILADIARRIAQQPDNQWRYSLYDDLTGELSHHGTTRARPTTGRFAAADAAFVRARDRTCRAPHCTAPATSCELDHTLAKVDGGGHHFGNGGPLCTRHHKFKHESGATLDQPQPGVFRWITPLGHHYTVRPEPHGGATSRANHRLTGLLAAVGR